MTRDSREPRRLYHYIHPALLIRYPLRNQVSVIGIAINRVSDEPCVSIVLGCRFDALRGGMVVIVPDVIGFAKEYRKH